VLSKDNPYLTQLLANDGLTQFLSPPRNAPCHPSFSKGDTLYNFSFSINCRDATPHCQISIRTPTASPTTTTSFEPLFSANYPPYSPDTPAPTAHWPESADPRAKEIADALWKSFCKNDFLSLDVRGTAHSDASWSFEPYKATVDESAVHRQQELFEHVTRYDHPEEIEAEKHFLVYRR
jgi:hypothetical protein